MSRASSRLLPIVLSGLFLLSGRPAAWAQSAQATLQGRITNQASGQPIVRALVIQRNLRTNIQTYRYTNEQGYYYFPALLPGTYTVRVDALGFQPEERSPLELTVASRMELDFALQTTTAPPAAAPVPQPPAARTRTTNILAIMYGADAAVPQAVMISLPPQVTETLVGSISSLIDENKILELPLSGRDVYTLLVLQPGVTSDNATARGLGFSVGGQRVSSSNFLLDGVDNNDLLVTGPATRVSADAVKEYRMTTSNFTAEFGRSSGFLANAITRTGTNELHGTLFEFFNHDRLTANSFANNCQRIPRPPFRQNQYGASVGGPLRKERLFFFGSFEQSHSSSESRFFPFTCLSQGQPREVFLPSSQFVSLLREGSRAKELLTLFPPPPGNPIPGNPFFVSHQYALPFVQGDTLLLGRLDFNSRDGRDRLSGRYSLSQQTADDFVFSVYPDLNAPLVVGGQNLVINYIRELAGGANELKFGYNRNSVRALRPHPEIPTMGLGNISLPGSEAAYDYFFRDTVFHILDNFSRLSGRHALGIGFEWRLAWHDSLLSPARDGFYSFATLSDFFSDDPIGLLISLNRQTRLPASDTDYRRFYQQREFAAFFQDNVKLTPRLTLNLGIRFEYFGVPQPRQTTRDYNFVFGSGQSIGERIASGRLETGPLYRSDRNNFAPRFGFAVDLLGNGKSVLRGGYGLFFDRVFNNFWLDARNNRLTVEVLFNCNQTAQILFNCAPQPPEFVYTFPARQGVKPAKQITPTSTVSVDRGLRTPYSQSWFVGFQQELTPNLMLEVNHAGSLGRKLATSDIINRSYSVPRSAEDSNTRFNRHEPDINYRANQGLSNYLALEVALNRRRSRGLQFQLSYTLSRSRDMQSDPLGRRASESQERSKRLGDSRFFENASGFTRQFDPRADYGRSDFDQTHNLMLNVIAQLPQLGGWWRLLSGWQAAGLIGIRSGFPFTVHSLADDGFIPPIGVASGGQLLPHNRPDFAGGDLDEAFLSTRRAIPGGMALLDPAKFRPPEAGKLGSVPRNAFRGPGFWNADFALSRSFALPRLGEQGLLQFRMEFFNLFNHTNLNNPDPFLGLASFGEATFGRQGFGSSLPSVSPLNEQPRRIQFAVKVYF